ncbi:MAG TPA: hypothetical protein VK797_22810 [Tepidisphaeraceae bacterium]|jgi:hypothetical protein|nr:hypothetical protein [Tepidisphaeraceae bacterium]
MTETNRITELDNARKQADEAKSRVENARYSQSRRDAWADYEFWTSKTAFLTAIGVQGQTRA